MLIFVWYNFYEQDVDLYVEESQGYFYTYKYGKLINISHYGM